jgi:hypothetical protein
VPDPHEFAENKLPRNLKTAEQIYQQLAIHEFRENRRIERAVEEAMKSATDAEEEISEKTAEIVSRLTDQELSSLADYTAKRKVVIDLLERRLGYKPDGTMKRYAEDAIHRVVCPMRISSSDVHIDKHNLWIIDDKLTYYDYWASDLQLKKYVKDSTSSSRPDVALFNGRTAFHRPGTDQPIVIVEFKRSARENYDYEENPIVQVYEYIEDLRSGKIVDKEGRIIDEIPEGKPFFCYVLADFTKNLKKYLNMTRINVALPGGGGYYGYNEEYNAFIQVLNYKYVVKDARLRNEAFFKRLGI